MKRQLATSILFTALTTALFGLAYPLVITGLAHLVSANKADGSLVYSQDGMPIGSALIAQPFTGDEYFHPRESAAGSGYDATNSGATNYAATNQKLVDRVKGDVAAAKSENPGKPVPIDMVTTSASGLDPDITPANAEFQAPRVAKARGITDQELVEVVRAHTQPRQMGFLGEPRINVLELNLDLDRRYPVRRAETSK